MAGCEARTAPRGIEAADNADDDGDGNGGGEELRIEVGLEQTADGGGEDEQLHAAEKPEQRRFQQYHADDPAAFPANGEQHANLLSALEDGHEHRVHHPEHAGDG